MAAYLTCSLSHLRWSGFCLPLSLFINLAPLKDQDWISAGVSGCEV